MKIAQTCQGDTLANLDQEGPNFNKKNSKKYVMHTQLHGTTIRRLDYNITYLLFQAMKPIEKKTQKKTDRADRTCTQ